MRIFPTLLCSFAFFVYASARPNYVNCLAEMIHNVTTSGISPIGYTLADLTDNYGKSVSDPSTATGMSYKSCVRVCGATNQETNWEGFAQQFSSWVLPSLAILSQLPFGSYRGLDDFIGVLLTIGSPSLAAYSLTITVLNGQWITRKFNGIRFGAARDAVRCLRSLQQTPLKISKRNGLLASLVVLPRNDEFWRRLADHLHDQASTWTVPAASSIVWVILAYLLTVIISFMQLTDFAFTVNGQAIGCAWCFLVAIVTGWLIVSPKCSARRNAKCMLRANRHAHVAPLEPFSSEDLAGILAFKVPSIGENRALEVIEEEDDLLHDQMCSQPIYNYARFHTWTDLASEVYRYYRNAHFHARAHIPVHGRDWRHNQQDANRVGTMEEVIEYCEDDRLTPTSEWRGRINDFLIACLSALALQWCTIGAGIIAFLYTPTTGLGCRSLSYVLYGLLSNIIWALFLVSSWLAHKANSSGLMPLLAPSPSTSPTFPHRLTPVRSPSSNFTFASDAENRRSFAPRSKRRNLRAVSIALRRLAKCLGSLNGLAFIALCLLQFLSGFDNCYCNSSVIGNGADKAYNVVANLEDGSDALNIMRNAFIASVVLSVGCSISFIVFVWTFLHPTSVSDMG
ncbi:hypothetical protein DL96DRAFT_1527707 [Flagelloscypha sp. PMI_526]|nr:hypothetical protein DL96DRAFT_1527707 [Flagelloscypha sp. PMI_526]